MRKILVLALVFGVAVGCSDDNPQTNNSNPNNSNTNNTNNETNNNTIIGVDCQTNDDCAAPDDNCQGEVAVSYSGPGLCSTEFGICNFTFVQESQDCAAINRTCEAGACVKNACTDIECPPPDDFCMGNTLHFYSGDGTCNLATAACEYEEFTTDCVAEGGECMFRTCVGACVGVMCDTPPAPSCAGTVATTYAAGMCDMATGDCAYPPTTTDCADNQMVCSNGACVADLCANVDCPQLPDTCDMNMAKVYSGVGTCDKTNGMCDYAQVETVTDCGADLCVNAACVNVTPAAGELVITEIMHLPFSVIEPMGEWFEIFNASARDLNIDGLRIESTNDVGYTVMLGQITTLAPGATYVFGINSDMTTNGMIPVTTAYTDIVLDTTDSLTLMAGAVVIDTVSWDDISWPTTAGTAMQFGSNYDPTVDDNALATNWCDATNVLASGDLGTPGAMNGTCN